MDIILGGDSRPPATYEVVLLKNVMSKAFFGRPSQGQWLISHCVSFFLNSSPGTTQHVGGPFDFPFEPQRKDTPPKIKTAKKQHPASSVDGSVCHTPKHGARQGRALASHKAQLNRKTCLRKSGRPCT